MGRLRAPAARLKAPRPRIGFATRQEAERDRDRVRRQKSGDNLRRLYNTARWKRLRAEILVRDGGMCRQTGVMLTGKARAPNSPVIDHIIPHKGNLALFWDRENLQAVSKEWHDREKQRRERAAQKGN